MSNRQPLRWFSVRDKAKRAWTVYLSCPELSQELEGNAGLTRRDTGTILVNVQFPHWEQDDTVLHELLHVALHDVELPPETEEYCVAGATPGLLHLLRKVCRIVWPKRPNGYTALARYARRNLETA